MALFDFLRRNKKSAGNELPLEQTSYDIAYFLLPDIIFNDVSRLVEHCQDKRSAGPFFYAMACKARGIEPQIESAKLYHWHSGGFDETRQYLLLEYPTPQPVELDVDDPMALFRSDTKIVLAPYFSLILYGNGEPVYYILGQSPMGGQTTFRQILAEGANCNLGPGPSPTIEEFLQHARGAST